MNITVAVEQVDAINYTLRGEIPQELIASNLEAIKKEDEAKKAVETTQKEQESKEEIAKEAIQNALKEMNPEERLQRKAEGKSLQDFIDAGLKKAGINVDDILGQPTFQKYEQQKSGFYVEVQIATSPKIDTDIEYEDIIPSYTYPVADPEEVEKKLIEMSKMQGKFEAIKTPRAVANNDVVVIDFEGLLDGVPFEGGSVEKFNLKIGSNSFIPGFEEQLIGMEYGEERTIKVTFPSNYQAADLAGKEAEFKIKLHEIQEQKPVKIDDKFAQMILKDDKATLDTLKQKLSDQLTSQQLSTLYNDELRPAIIKGLLTKFDFPLPINVVEQEISAKINEKAQTMSQEEQKALQTDKEKFKALREEVRQEAEESIKAAMIIEAMAKKEGIEVDDQEVMSALYYQAMISGQDPNQLVEYYQKNHLMTSAKMSLTQDKLLGKMLGFDKR